MRYKELMLPIEYQAYASNQSHRYPAITWLLFYKWRCCCSEGNIQGRQEFWLLVGSFAKLAIRPSRTIKWKQDALQVLWNIYWGQANIMLLNTCRMLPYNIMRSLVSFIYYTLLMVCTNHPWIQVNLLNLIIWSQKSWIEIGVYQKRSSTCNFRSGRG